MHIFDTMTGAIDDEGLVDTAQNVVRHIPDELKLDDDTRWAVACLIADMLRDQMRDTKGALSPCFTCNSGAIQPCFANCDPMPNAFFFMRVWLSADSPKALSGDEDDSRIVRLKKVCADLGCDDDPPDIRRFTIVRSGLLDCDDDPVSCLSSISALHDREGALLVDWGETPTDEQMRRVERAWARQCEYLVTHFSFHAVIAGDEQIRPQWWWR